MDCFYSYMASQCRDRPLSCGQPPEEQRGCPQPWTLCVSLSHMLECTDSQITQNGSVKSKTKPAADIHEVLECFHVATALKPRWLLQKAWVSTGSLACEFRVAEGDPASVVSGKPCRAMCGVCSLPLPSLSLCNKPRYSMPGPGPPCWTQSQILRNAGFCGWWEEWQGFWRWQIFWKATANATLPHSALELLQADGTLYVTPDSASWRLCCLKRLLSLRAWLRNGFFTDSLSSGSLPWTPAKTSNFIRKGKNPSFLNVYHWKCKV